MFLSFSPRLQWWEIVFYVLLPWNLMFSNTSWSWDLKKNTNVVRLLTGFQDLATVIGESVWHFTFLVCVNDCLLFKVWTCCSGLRPRALVCGFLVQAKDISQTIVILMCSLRASFIPSFWHRWGHSISKDGIVSLVHLFANIQQGGLWAGSSKEIQFPVMWFECVSQHAGQALTFEIEERQEVCVNMFELRYNSQIHSMQPEGTIRLACLTCMLQAINFHPT